jgi:gluconate kinase
VIIFVGGLVGVGKSSVAKGLAREFNLHYYDVDIHKKSIYTADPDYQKNMELGIPFSKATRFKVFERVVKDFVELSKSHTHIIVDETLHKEELRNYLFAGAKKYFGGYTVVWVKASEKVILERLAKKERKGHILKDPVKMHNAFLKEFEPFKESLIVARNDGELDDTLEQITPLVKQALI